MDEKEVLRRFGLPYHEELDTGKALVGIMRKLLELEEKIDQIPIDLPL